MNDVQKEAFLKVQSGKNIFLTGPAGSGKSYLIREILLWAESVGKKVGLTALTGCAALLLGIKAKTLHSWAGVGLARESADSLVASISKNVASKKRWKQVNILIIDEVSMMTPEFFEKLDIIGKHIRKNTAPYGGIQLIVCGDFFQLPPVVKGISGEQAIGRFAFESPAWANSQLTPMILTKIERQTDIAFQQVLNECRIGAPSARSIELLKSRQGLDWKTHLIRPTLLFSRNADVDTINEKNLVALKQPLFKYEAKTEFIPDPLNPMDPPTGELLERYVQRLDSDANYSPHLELCLNAQVMLIYNMDIEKGLVNGSRGVIVGFRSDTVPIVQFLHGEPIPIEPHLWQSTDSPILYRSQIPLRVAYALTIHKSQGATLDCALIDIGSSTFEYGQAYVALSRVRDLQSLYIWNLDPTKIKAHPRVVEFYQQLMECPNTIQSAVLHPDSWGVELTDDGWRSIVTAWSTTITGRTCLERVHERSMAVKVFPEPESILAALRIPLRSVKVVILGQDPYHGQGQAHGLSFSVKKGIMPPPSLKNIRKELLEDIPTTKWPPNIGDLSPWVNQGVLLLNSVLTVEEGKPNSHENIGWEDLTLRLLGAVVSSHADTPLVFLAWGKNAQSIVYKLKLGPKHLILAAAHPSPLSSYAGFFGSKPFSKANKHLLENNTTVINWSLRDEDNQSEDPY
jgi:ATP-dependent DNA helicase PIF1